MTKKKMVHLALRISPELNARVEECAQALRLKKHTVAQAAVEAAVDAIEKNDYRLVFPIKFDVTQVAMEKSSLGKSPSSTLATQPAPPERAAPEKMPIKKPKAA